MAKQSKTLQLMALKLGLNDEEKVVSKAAEFERLLQMKTLVKNITDTAKAVICLDLAATFFGVSLDVKTAIKCSGLKTPAYTNSRKVIENQLDLNSDKVTVSGLCLTLQCEVQDLAEKILEEYRKGAKVELDLDLPQYACMAVYQACRISKIKVSKSKLIEKAQLKPAQWTKLDAEWTKITDAKFTAVVKKKGKLAKKTEDVEEMEIDNQIPKKEVHSLEPEIEPYEDWKRRMLEEAYKELEQHNTNKQKTNKIANKTLPSPNKQLTNTNKQLPNINKETKAVVLIEKMANINKLMDVKEVDSVNKNDIKSKSVILTYSPRRSPRKTPKKFEPYKSPIKEKGVRLLFPS